jgi:hypothetical protein
MWGQPPLAVHSSTARLPFPAVKPPSNRVQQKSHQLSPVANPTSPPTLMNLPRHNRRLRRIVRRNRNPTIQCPPRRHTLRRSTAPAQKRESRRRSSINLRASADTTTRNRKIIFSRLQRRGSDPAQRLPSRARCECRPRSATDVCHNTPRTVQHANVVCVTRVIRGRNVIRHLRCRQRKRQHYSP